MERRDFIRKAIMINLTLGLTSYLASCSTTEHDILDVDQDNLSQIRNILNYQKAIYVTAKRNHVNFANCQYSRRIDIDIDRKGNHLCTKLSDNVYNSTMYITGVIINKDQSKIDVLKKHNYGHLIEFISDDIVHVKYNIPSPISQKMRISHSLDKSSFDKRILKVNIFTI